MGDPVNNARKEFEKYLKKWTISGNRFLNGVDVGCGSSRIDDMIVSLDQQANYEFAHAQFVWDCKNLDLFADEKLDFIFSSHCLEDFEDIPTVFCNWWKKLKVGGMMLLLLPDMEPDRYPKVGAPRGNPSHRTNTGKEFILKMLDELKKSDRVVDYAVEQIDIIPHTECCSIDIAIRKVR